MSASTKLFVISVTIYVLLFAGCKKTENGKSEEKKDTLKIEVVRLSVMSIKEIGLQTERIKVTPFAGFITIPAKVLVNQDNEAQVGSLVQGRVVKVFAKVGDYVKVGQELLLVEGLEIGVIKSGFLKAKAILEYQRSNFERQKSLSDQKIGSQKSFLEAKSEYEKALAEYNAEDKKIHSIGLSDADIIGGKSDPDKEHTSGTLMVRSPINGVIVERNVVIGQLVDVSTNAFKIINTSAVWVDGQIYEKDFYKITDKSAVTFTSSFHDNEKFSGKISYIGQVIDEKTRTLTIRAEFKNSGGKLKPQMFGDMNILAKNNSKAILVPSEALIKINNQDYVFIQMNDSTFQKREVKIGSSQSNRVEIKDGLKENETIVVKGAFYLKSELLKSELGGE